MDTQPKIELPELGEEEAMHSVILFAVSQPAEQVMFFLTDNAIPYRVLLGQRDQEPEISYIVPYQHFGDVLLSGLVDDQDSILLLGQMNDLYLRPAQIIEAGKQPEPVGYLQPISREAAMGLPAWSYDAAAMVFFALVTEN